ncbi:10943_t:CDS:2 [Ambispora gerdemannii]|uniref:10943_t:CDS:1 n=1 Tax=Ambispora gerdemannii TaxID=144530 RepID=A0A9N9H2Y3_9GLOM|nr:10943_t:CDS:2 [Ambispora gerdemannii]
MISKCSKELSFTAPGKGALPRKWMGCTTAKVQVDTLPQSQRIIFEEEKLKKQLAKHLSALSVNSTSMKEVWIYYHKVIT